MQDNQGIQIYEFQLCCMSSFIDTIKAPFEEICALPEWFKENGGLYRRGKSGYTLILEQFRKIRAYFGFKVFGRYSRIATT